MLVNAQNTFELMLYIMDLKEKAKVKELWNLKGKKMIVSRETSKGSNTTTSLK